MELSLQRIYDVLTDIRPGTDFTSSDNFVDDGLLDSLDIILLVTAFEAKFTINIDGSSIVPENFRSANAMMALISKYTEGRAGQ